MPPIKTFHVFGDPVDVLTAASQTNRTMSAITQTCQPGGGPPPHWHDREDEFFMVLEGQFEIFNGTTWTTLKESETAFALRGQVHTFRNNGDTVAKILCVSTPGQLDEYLEAISPIVMPQDAPRLFEISDDFGIHFLGNEAAAAA